MNLETQKSMPTSCLQEYKAEASEEMWTVGKRERVLISEVVHLSFGKPKINKILQSSIRSQAVYLSLSHLKGIYST